jgi:hypothetical protein
VDRTCENSAKSKSDGTIPWPVENWTLTCQGVLVAVIQLF